jgi:hypothetical protein
LREYTNAELRAPLKLMLWASTRYFDAAVIEATRAAATSAFGPATSTSGEFATWDMPVPRLDDALEFVFDANQRPKPLNGIGPIDLYVCYSFRWKTMSNPQVLPRGHFARGNFLGVSIGAWRLFIQPTFLFEATDGDLRFIADLRRLETAMPFAPNDTYYYRIEPKKTGPGEKLVKLHKGWKSAA